MNKLLIATAAAVLILASAVARATLASPASGSSATEVSQSSIAPKPVAQRKDAAYDAEMSLPGVRRLEVERGYKVWTRRVGHGPIKVLMLHGGPGLTHEYLEGLADSLAQHGFEVYLYEQLGSYFSDQPDVVSGDPIWTVTNRVEELEAVRKQLGLNRFVLYGHSWGAALGLEYAAKYQGHLQGFVFSSMNYNLQAFVARQTWAQKQVEQLIGADPLGRQLLASKKNGQPYDQEALGELSKKYMMENFAIRAKRIPESAASTEKHQNLAVQNEIGQYLFNPDYARDLASLRIPVLLIAGAYDPVVSAEDLAAMHRLVSRSTVVISPQGGHNAMLDDLDEYLPPILSFLSSLTGAVAGPGGG